MSARKWENIIADMHRRLGDSSKLRVGAAADIARLWADAYNAGSADLANAFTKWWRADALTENEAGEQPDTAIRRLQRQFKIKELVK